MITQEANVLISNITSAKDKSTVTKDWEDLRKLANELYKLGMIKESCSILDDVSKMLIDMSDEDFIALDRGRTPSLRGTAIKATIDLILLMQVVSVRMRDLPTKPVVH